MAGRPARRRDDDNPVESSDVVIAVNTALIGVPAAYAASGSVTVTAIAAALAATVTAIAHWARRRR